MAYTSSLLAVKPPLVVEVCRALGAVGVTRVIYVDDPASPRDGEILEDLTGSERSGQVDWQCADISRTSADLGWGPVYSLEDTVASVVERWAVAT